MKKFFPNLKIKLFSLVSQTFLKIKSFAEQKKKYGKEPIPNYWSIPLIWSLSAGLVFSLAGQLTTPFHVLTHEFTQLYTLLTAYVLYFLGWWAAKKVSRKHENLAPLSRMRKASYPMTLGTLAMGLTPLALMAITNALLWGCQFYRGVPFFAVTWVPVALTAALGGILAGTRGWGWLKTFGLIEMVIGLSIIQDTLQMVNGARIVDFVIGAPLAFDQRADMDIPEVHFFQRIFVMLVAYSIWNLGQWRFGRTWKAGGLEYRTEMRHIRVKALSSSVLAVVLALGLGSHIGLGWGRAEMNRELSQVLRTEHFVFRYAPGGNAENSIEATVSGAEWYMNRLITHWNVTLRKPVVVYVFDGYEHMNRLTGIGAAHAIFNKLFIAYYSATESTFYHELVHALHQAALRPKLTVWFNRGIVEGLAEAYHDELVWLPEAHRNHSGALRAGMLPSATDFMSALGFWKIHESIAYDSAASFIGFLIYKYGIDAFKGFQRHLNYKRAFGKDLQQLDTDWKQFLKAVRVDVETQIRAGDYFEAAYWGAYSRECCPKLGEKHPTLEERAGRLWISRHYDKAYTLYKNLFETTRESRWGYQAALCLEKQHRFDEALELLNDLLNRENVTDFERVKILSARTSVLMALQNWPALYTTLEELSAYEKGEPSQDGRIVEWLLRQPELRATAAEALITEDSYEKRRLLEGLAERYPDNIRVQYLYATRGFGSMYIRGGGAAIPPERESQILALLNYIEKVPDTADKLVDTMLDFSVASIQARNFALAERIGQILMRHIRNPFNRFRVERLLERVDFEYQYSKKAKTDEEINTTLIRRDLIIAWLDKRIKKMGEEKVLY